MKRKNIIIYVSSRNNYDMLEGEVLNNIDTEGFEFINVDDNSCEEELEKGKAICEKHGIVFLENKDRGVQMATQTLIDFINKNRPNCKWIICFQHDIYPISTDFFSKLSNYINEDKLDDFGIIGFNVLDRGEYTKNSYDEFCNKKQPNGFLGLCHLSIHNNVLRTLCPKNHIKLMHDEKWKHPFLIEIPMWAVVGINIDLWNEYIIPTNEYQFHLWLPDIAMQFNFKNKGCVILPKLYCLNHQELKIKYNIDKSSAGGAMRGNDYHFGKYSNFKIWKERWGWEYENPKPYFNSIKEHYKNTLIGQFMEHDSNEGPLKTINLL